MMLLMSSCCCAQNLGYSCNLPNNNVLNIYNDFLINLIHQHRVSYQGIATLM